ncbi:MAG: adenylate/guanylate cyclase domain-containing protein [Actinomycetota bacterium]
MATESTFLFADLSGFTALTEVHGDEQAADLAGEFSAAVRELLPDHSAEEVKSIGDALMVRCEVAEHAVRLGLRIVYDVGERHGFPIIRVGMHTGPAVERDGDWFGAAVNLAARVSGVASGDEVLCTEATREAAGRMDDVELIEHGRQELRNIAEPVMIYRALCEIARTAEGLPIDPVCRMAVDPDHAAGTLVHRGVQYRFCSLECVRAFAESPERYASEQ